MTPCRATKHKWFVVPASRATVQAYKRCEKCGAIRKVGPRKAVKALQRGRS